MINHASSVVKVKEGALTHVAIGVDVDGINRCWSGWRAPAWPPRADHVLPPAHPLPEAIERQTQPNPRIQPETGAIALGLWDYSTLTVKLRWVEAIIPRPLSHPRPTTNRSRPPTS